MATLDNQQLIKNVRQRNYLARDFDGFRSVLLDYARQYYGDRIQDFSEASVGGLFLDLASYIGDNMSFYMDHLYGEMNPDTVTETDNAENIIRSSGVQIVGGSPSLVYVDFFVEIPVLSDDSLTPDPTLLPTIESGATLLSYGGIYFTLMEEVHFWKTDPVSGETLINNDVTIRNGRKINGNIVSKILIKRGLCTSGSEISESFDVSDFIPFRRIFLSKRDVTKIMRVYDTLGNNYYEVDDLSHDVVYKNAINASEKDDIAKETLKIIPAPYRFLKRTSLGNRNTALIFGGGNADSLDKDIIPDPSTFALSLPYTQTFGRQPINPQKLLQTNTLGVIAPNTTITVVYRYGGGLSHNVPAGSIRQISTVNLVFPENPPAGSQSKVRISLEVNNPESAAGGEDPPSKEELLALVPSVKYSQERIVTKEDLLARVYSMPSNFGRVFRAAVSRNPNNPLASQLFIISRNQNNDLIPSTDALKINLKRYLNSYRMVSDAIDILDAAVINLEIFFQIVADPAYNRNALLQSILSDLISQYSIGNMNINQPIIISDIISTIFSKTGVISVDKIQVRNLYGTVKNLTYSSIPFDVQMNTKNQIIYPPQGAIFEIKYPDVNIIGRAVSNA